MVRVKRGLMAKKKHKSLRKATLGMRASNRRTIKSGRQALMKAGSYAYRDRRVKKRTFRALWIARLNAFLRTHDTTYSKFMADLKKNKINLDRKILAELAVSEPKALEKIINSLKNNPK